MPHSEEDASESGGSGLRTSFPRHDVNNDGSQQSATDFSVRHDEDHDREPKENGLSLLGAHDQASAADRPRGNPWHLRDVAKIIIRSQRIIKTWNIKTTCANCDSLKLTVDKFIIQDHSSDKNQQAYRTYLPPSSVRPDSTHSLGSGSRKYRLGTLQDIQRNSRKCPFCSLVLDSLKLFDASFDSTLDHSAQCYASWQVDGREVERNRHGAVVSSRARTRRIHLQWDSVKFQDAYLVLVAPEIQHRLVPNSLHHADSEALFLGRNIDSAGNNQVLVKRWLDLCHDSHGDLCTVKHDQGFEDMISSSYFGVVDVHEMRLTSLPSGERYVALSYMWGAGERYTTSLTNVHKHQAYGGLEKVFPKLPRVITDAIKLVRGLGERYLWVDSLCIVQESARSWTLNSAVMDLVYGHAHLTICAADGEGATTGLKGVNPAERQIIQHVEECGPNVRLMVSHLAETYIRRSTWNTRAWTFQERLLSKRCLIFADGRVFFQCRSTAMSEDVNAEQKDAGWSIELVQAPLQMLHELNTRVFWVYMNCVRLYTARHLGRTKDVLAAFTGMSNLLGAKMGAPLVFGLPSAYFDLALLWEAHSAATRRLPRTKEESKDYDGARFPSWSWCGWMGSTMAYNSSTIEACLPNVHEWLTEHTWISWYIRDSHGNLRPIWNGSIHGEGCAWVEGRWRGYGTTLPPGTPCDAFGRSLREEFEPLHRSTFYRTLPEYPYRVSIASADAKRDPQFPDQCFLQFWTWSAFLRLYPDRQASHKTVGADLCRYDIADYTRDWCGTILLSQQWGDQWAPGKEHEFIALSAAKDFSAEENNVWTYYIPKEKGQSEWDLYYVLLIEHKGEIAHRVGLGKVFKEAFSNSCLPGKQWKEIILA